MIIVDSSVWIDYFNGKDTSQTDKLDELLGVEPIAIGDIILTAECGDWRLRRFTAKYQSLKFCKDFAPTKIIVQPKKF